MIIEDFQAARRALNRSSSMMYRCPQCKGVDLQVIVSAWATLKQEGPDEFETDTSTPNDGSHYWHKNSSMKCINCGYAGVSHMFESPDWSRCSWSDSVHTPDCGKVVERGENYFSSPCGTYCEEHMAEHALDCEICSDEFGLPHNTDEKEENANAQLSS